ncbi:hypothetical protein [Haloquadratum walsbyi]|uniref:Uncharacterized protein n=1 Tax=Haloquadratum walsbyi J07HQW2 TaxID=1238425 RepID=U1PM45_9EURY|nr:hypothetical protein [Haloquadratum walsbyi]ERG94782.1 MAG: hypothetical protein J07HQW2_01224 [Haloquadratum walsbyi J07HQW2]
MAPVSVNRFATLLRGLEQSRFIDFVAALWDARSDTDVTVGQRFIHVGDSDENESQTVIAVIGHSWIPDRFRQFSVPETVDILITTQQTKRYIETTDAVDARIIGPAELHSIALYAVSRPTAETLFNTYFDTSITVNSSHNRERNAHHRIDNYIGYELSDTLISLIQNTRFRRSRPVGTVFILIIILIIIAGSGIALGVMPGTASNVSPGLSSEDSTVGTAINELTVEIQMFLGISSTNAEQQSLSRSESETTSAPLDPGSQLTSNESQSGETEGNTQTLLGYPPGVTTTGIVDPDRLAAAHANTVSGQSYRYDVNKQHVNAFGGQTWQELSEEAIVASQVEYLYTATGTLQSTNETEDVNLSVYADRSDAYIRVDRESETNVSFGKFSVSGGEFGSNNGRFANRAESILQRYLDTSESRIVLSKLNNETYSIVATGQPFGLNTDGRVNDYQAVAQVNEQGFVSSFTASYRRVTENKTTTVSVSFNYEDIGSATPSQPQWYTTAQNETARSTRE